MAPERIASLILMSTAPKLFSTIVRHHFASFNNLMLKLVLGLVPKS